MASKKDNVIAILRNAFNQEHRKFLASGKKVGSAFAGSPQLAESKLPSAVFARAIQTKSKSKKESEFRKIPETDERFKALVSAIKGASASLEAGKWDSKVAGVFNTLLSIRGARQGGGRAPMAADAVKGLIGSL